MGAGMGEFEGLVGRKVGLARRAKPAGNRRAWTFGWIPEEDLVREESGHRDFWDRYSADPEDWAGAATPQRTRHGWVRGPGEPSPARAADLDERTLRASPASGSPAACGSPARVRPRRTLRVDVGKATSSGDASPVSVLSRTRARSRMGGAGGGSSRRRPGGARLRGEVGGGRGGGQPTFSLRAGTTLRSGFRANSRGCWPRPGHRRLEPTVRTLAVSWSERPRPTFPAPSRRGGALPSRSRLWGTCRL